MGIDKNIRVNNEIADRYLADFDFDNHRDYNAMRTAAINDFDSVSSQYKFEINDIQLAVPPLFIGINKEALDYSYKTLRSKSTTKLQSSNAVFHVSLTLLFPRECLLQLHRLIIQIRNNPFVYINNKYLQASTDHNSYFKELIEKSNDGTGYENSSHFTVFNIQVSNYQQSPGAFLIELDLRYFNHNAYSSSLLFKKELLYQNIGLSKLTTISVYPKVTKDKIGSFLTFDHFKTIGKGDFSQTTYSDVYTSNPGAIKTIADDYLFSRFVSEKVTTFPVESAKQSNIYVRFYNRLQVKALHDNFNINVKQLLLDFGYEDVLDWYETGIENEKDLPLYVFSIANKHFPTHVRSEIIDLMLTNDSDIKIYYNTYHKLKLEEKHLTKLNSILKKDVVFNRDPDNLGLIKKNETALNANEKILKENLEAANADMKAFEAANSKEDVEFYQTLLNFVKLNTNQATNFRNLSFMMISEDMYNVFSYTEEEVITIDYQEEKYNSQLKSLVVTSMSGMISNQIATIPILGHHYPTHQYIGSTEPKYSMTFIGQTLPDSRDGMSIGIQKLENIKNILAYNSNVFKFIPNSNCFSLDSFITRLFDSIDITEIPKLEDNSLGLIKKKLSINALNTQTIESLPGMSSGTIRISETNSFDYEKVSQVYSSELENFSSLSNKITDALSVKNLNKLPLKYNKNTSATSEVFIQNPSATDEFQANYGILSNFSVDPTKKATEEAELASNLEDIKEAFLESFQVASFEDAKELEPGFNPKVESTSESSLINELVEKLNSVYGSDNEELRKIISRFILLEEMLAYSLYPVIGDDVKLNQKLIDIYPDISFSSSLKNKTGKELRDENKNIVFDFLNFLLCSGKENVGSTAAGTYVETTTTVLSLSAGAAVGVASATGAIALPVLVVVGLGFAISTGIEYFGNYLSQEAAFNLKESNYLSVKKYLQNKITLDPNKRSVFVLTEELKKYNILKDNEISALFNNEEKEEIKKELDNISKDIPKIPIELNNKNDADSSLENVFPNIIKSFIESNIALRLYPNIFKTFLANGMSQTLIISESISADEFLGGAFYSILSQLFWYPSEVDPVSNDDKYNTLFENDVNTGEVFNADILESFDMDKDNEQKYLKNIMYQSDEHALFRYRLKDTGNISQALRQIWTNVINPDFYLNNDIYDFLFSKEKRIEQKIDSLNKNIIRAFRLEKENLLNRLLTNDKFVDYLSIISPNDFKSLKVISEVEGIDLSKENCYPDIELPLIPLVYNKTDYLNPGFFYFNQELDFLNEYEKENRREIDIQYSKSIFLKSKNFMNAMKTDGIYSGTENKASLQKRSNDGTLAISFDELLYDMRDEALSEKIKIVKDEEEASTIKIDLKWDYDSGNLTYKVEGTESTINVTQLHGTVGYDYLAKFAEEIIKTNEFKTAADKSKFLEDALEAKKQQLQKLFSKSTTDTLGDKSAKTDLYSFTNQTIIKKTNRSGSLDALKKSLIDDALKIFKGDDQYSDGEKVIEELGIQAFSDIRSIKQAYPTFKFYLVEEDVADSSNFNVYDDFYSYNGVKDITIYKSRKLAADTAIIRLQNISGSIDGTKTNIYRDVDYEMGLVDIENIEEGNRSNNLGIQSIMLRPGVTSQIRIGYDSNPNNLQVMLSGKVTDVNWSSNGDLCEIVVQSFGVELLAKRLGTSADPEVSEIPFKDTQTLLGFIIHQSDMNHFGRFKTNSQSIEGENKNLMIRLDYSLDETLFNNTTNSIMTTINNITFGIAAMAILGTVIAYFTRNTAITQSILQGIRNFGSIAFKGLGQSLTLVDDAAQNANQIVIAAGFFARTGALVGNTARLIGQLLAPVWTYVFRGLFGANGLFRASTAMVLGRSQAINQFGLLGTLIRLGNTSSSLTNIGFWNFLIHGLVMPGLRTASTVMIFNVLAVGIAGNSIESMVRYIRWGYNNLIGYDMTKKYFKDKYKSTIIKLSPADDCIYVPDRELYINTDDEAKLKEPFLTNISNYLNTVKHGFLDDTTLGNFINGLIGSRYWKFTLEKENTVMSKDDMDDLAKQTFLLSDKRLSIIDYSSYYYIVGRTAWEVLNEMTLRHTGWITGARPYGLGLEYRLFFGKPNDIFYYKEFSQNTIKLLNASINHLYDVDKSDSNKTKFTAKASVAKKIPDETKRLIPSNVRLAFKDLAFSYDVTATLNESMDTYERFLQDYLVRNLYDKTSQRRKPFRQYHMLSSRFNLVSNSIQVSERTHNAINVKFRYKTNDTNKEEKIFTRQLKLHDNIPDEKLNVADIDFPECKGYAGALRYGVSTLLLETKEMYDGEVICLGKPNINPHDVCILEDTYNNIYGGIEVEAVTHLFSAETGYLTEIRPNMICTSNESTTYPILQTQAIFEASKRVVEEIKLTSSQLKDASTIRKEIAAVVDKYFDTSVSARTFDELKGKDNFGNNFDLEAILGEDTQATIDVLKQVTTELIALAYERKDLNFVNNMSFGIAQLPESIKNSLNKISEDALVVSILFGTVAVGLNRFIKLNADTLTAFQRNVSVLLTKTQDMSLYAAMASSFTAIFGENIVENYMGHQSTMYKIADSLNQTNFAKVNDGTLIQMWPLFRNNKPLVANGVEYIKQNYIWHNRFGEIYNTISDASFGYLNEKERIQSFTKIWEKEEDVNFGGQPLLYLKYLITSRYNPAHTTTKQLYAYDQIKSTGLERK